MKQNEISGFYFVCFFGILGLAISSESFANEEENEEYPMSRGCVVDRAALEDIQRVKKQNSEKQKELASKEADLKAREKFLNEEIKKLEEGRETLGKTIESRKQENSEKVTKLVETLLQMKPKTASRILASVDESLAVAAISQMDQQKLAKILNSMEPAKASKLSEILAGVNKK